MIEPTQASAVLSPDEASLRRACAQMEGVFLSHLMKAMRETIPPFLPSGERLSKDTAEPAATPAGTATALHATKGVGAGA